MFYRFQERLIARERNARPNWSAGIVEEQSRRWSKKSRSHRRPDQEQRANASATPNLPFFQQCGEAMADRWSGRVISLRQVRDTLQVEVTIIDCMTRTAADSSVFYDRWLSARRLSFGEAYLKVIRRSRLFEEL